MFLVTGGGGFLGRYIVEQLLARGDAVRVFARGAYPELEALGAEVVRGDVTDADTVSRAVADCECVVHTAALPGIAMRWQPYHDTNLLGTRNVLAACREHGVGRLVYTSSPSVVFDGRDHEGVDESVPYGTEWLAKNAGHYSRSKAMAEAEVLVANGDGLKTCALRPHLIWGPRDNHLIPRLIARAKSGRLRRVGDGTNRVAMVYVENAAAAHLFAINALAAPNPAAAGKAYFISQAEPVNCWQWIDEILALADVPPVKKSISLSTASRLGHACELAYRTLGLKSEPPMTRFLAAQLAHSHWFSTAAAERDLGYRPTVSTGEGMERLGQWLQTQA
ncbi:MAG: NAD-dependent epimerase/dehydratase family protein [Planctomycetota bacterium]